MENEKSKIVVYPGNLLNEKLSRRETVVIEKCYCPNGHNLIRVEVYFADYQAICLKIQDKKEIGYIYLNPIVGEKSKVLFDNWLVNNKMYEFICPDCKAPLPVFSPCSCGGQLITLFLDDTLKISNCVAFCNKIGCTHSEIKSVSNLRSIYI